MDCCSEQHHGLWPGERWPRQEQNRKEFIKGSDTWIADLNNIQRWYPLQILWNHHHHQVMAGLSSDSTDVNGHLDRFERHLLYYLLYLIKKVWTTPLDVEADLFSCYQDWTTSPTTTPLCGLGPITHLPTPIGNCDYYYYYYYYSKF